MPPLLPDSEAPSEPASTPPLDVEEPPDELLVELPLEDPEELAMPPVELLLLELDAPPLELVLLEASVQAVGPMASRAPSSAATTGR